MTTKNIEKTTKKTGISRPIKPDPKPEKPKITSADIVNTLNVLNNTTDNLALILINVLEELKENHKTQKAILKKLNAPTISPVSAPPQQITLPPPPAVPEVPNTGLPFRPQGPNTGDPIPQQPIITSSSAPAPNIPGAVSPEEAGRILRQKMDERKQQPQQQQQIPIGKSAGGAIARPAQPIPGTKQVGDISDSIKMDWLGEDHPI